MRITDALLGEHGVLHAQLDHLEASLVHEERIEGVRRLAALLAAGLVPHARIENELLFEPLAEAAGPGPVLVMIDEHGRIEAALEEVEAIADPDRAKARVLEAIALARDHFRKEERIAFPLAETTFGAARIEALGQRWAGERGVELA